MRLPILLALVAMAVPLVTASHDPAATCPEPEYVTIPPTGTDNPYYVRTDAGFEGDLYQETGELPGLQTGGAAWLLHRGQECVHEPEVLPDTRLT